MKNGQRHMRSYIYICKQANIKINMHILQRPRDIRKKNLQHKQEQFNTMITEIKHDLYLFWFSQDSVKLWIYFLLQALLYN